MSDKIIPLPTGRNRPRPAPALNRAVQGDVVAFVRTHRWANPTLFRNLAVHDWTGRQCERCGGYGEDTSEPDGVPRACSGCAGTGEDYDFICWGPIDMRPEHGKFHT